MATKVKPSRLQVTGTPQAGDVPVYVDEDSFQWLAGGGGGGGDVVGPASSTDGNIVLFNGTTGKAIKDSGVGLSSKLDAAALSNDAYGSSWDGDSTHTPTKDALYDKISAMDTTIGSKADDSSVVKLTGNQTIAGTKTFSTSPVVPSKTTDATNTGTAIATEAQVYKVDSKVSDLFGLGKFLSLWNAATGLPISFPLSTPYTYTTGDYYLVETVSSATPPVNYKPTGSSYSGAASTTTESGELEVGDIYIYDGTTWLLQLNHGKTISFSEIAGDPYDNTDLSDALTAKQDELVSGTNIRTINGTSILGSGDITTPVGPTYTAGTGISIVSDVIANTGVTSVNGNTGAVTLTIPTVNDATLTIQKNGTNVQTFTANQSTNATANITVPTDTGDLTNGAGFLTSSTGVTSFNGSTGAVTYTAPVTSVNGSTGAVTVNAFSPSNAGSTGNVLTKTSTGYRWSAPSSGSDVVKMFDYPSVGDDISNMLGWLGGGGGAVMAENVTKYYTVLEYDDQAGYVTAINNDSSTHTTKVTINVDINSEVTSITTDTLNYFVPSNAGTTDQVLTKTAGGYQWATPSGGGDVMVSSQANNILTSGMKIWAGTQANYEGLGTYDNNTVYLTIE